MDFEDEERNYSKKETRECKLCGEYFIPVLGDEEFCDTCDTYDTCEEELFNGEDGND